MCGIFGIFGHPEAANIAYLGLHGLQHRGQESAGLISSDGEQMFVHRSMGLVQAGFSPGDLERLSGRLAIGHVRYSTSGASHIRDAQPFAVDYRFGSLAIAHNGNLTNHAQLRRGLEAGGSIFQTGGDTEAIVHLIAVSEGRSFEERAVDALRQVRGAFSLVLMTENALLAVRDPRGFRPLCLGLLPVSGSRQGGEAKPAYAVASEPSSFDLIGARWLRDLEPGEMIVIDDDGLRSSHPLASAEPSTCLFEYVYFARPDSHIDSIHVYQARKRSGRRLIAEHPVVTDDGVETVVVPVPDSGVAAALGVAEGARVAFEMGLIRSHYVGRTFIEPQQSIRHFGVRLKLNPNAGALRGRRVIVVDDSIVRGTTSRKLVSMLRGAGAREVHVRISSPPTAWPCYYGIDTPRRAELIAAKHSVEQIREYLTADSLGYLSLEGLREAVAEAAAAADPDAPPCSGRGRFCDACFSGRYPVPFETDPPQRQLRLVNA